VLFFPALLASRGSFFFLFLLILLPVGCCSKDTLPCPPPFHHLSLWFLFLSKMDSFSSILCQRANTVYLRLSFKWVLASLELFDLFSLAPLTAPTFRLKISQGQPRPDGLYCPFSNSFRQYNATNKLSPAADASLYSASIWFEEKTCDDGIVPVPALLSYQLVSVLVSIR
jgi:hypothetical protein